MGMPFREACSSSSEEEEHGANQVQLVYDETVDIHRDIHQDNDRIYTEIVLREEGTQPQEQRREQRGEGSEEELADVVARSELSNMERLLLAGGNAFDVELQRRFALTGMSDDEWEDPSENAILTFLHGAIEQGQDNLVASLLPLLSVPVETLGPHGDSALHVAAVYGRLTCVEVLLEYGHPANIADSDQGQPLHDAAAGGYVDIVKLLLEQAPETINSRDNDGDTPLHNAARGDHPDVIRVLLEAGADVDVVNSSELRAIDLTSEGSAAHQILYGREL